MCAVCTWCMQCVYDVRVAWIWYVGGVFICCGCAVYVCVVCMVCMVCVSLQCVYWVCMCYMFVVLGVYVVCVSFQCV